MATRDLFKLPSLKRRLPTLRAFLKHADKRPFTGITQGGSSRRDAGAKVAATNAIHRQTTRST